MVQQVGVHRRHRQPQQMPRCPLLEQRHVEALPVERHQGVGLPDVLGQTLDQGPLLAVVPGEVLAQDVVLPVQRMVPARKTQELPSPPVSRSR